ncbi:M56 family metallopeptidase [Clostridium rectalis]|uniref:M56 family metallopeptidase n=1 Tax=Clostridium rectalis TaxID=2040295 RepID=UPI000F631C4C|nr:M56 family metallopeptidase [Clostridium rectalis]
MDKSVFYLFLIFRLVMEMSIFSIIPIVSITILNKLLNKKISIKFQYILYIFILIRLILPIMPKSSLSLYNKAKILVKINNKNNIVEMIKNENKDRNYDNSLNYYKEKNTDFNNPKYLSFTHIINKFNVSTKYLFIIWCLGLGILTIYTILTYVIFHKKIKQSGKNITDNTILDFMLDCTKLLKIKNSFKLLELDYINSPATFGIKKPMILIPKGMFSKLGKKDLKNILLHELCHCKRKDILIIYLCKIISILYWFNPLIWLTINELKKSLELSCDEMVLSYINKEEKLNYGYTILNILSCSKNKSSIYFPLNILGTKKELSKRLSFIRDFKKKSVCNKSISLIGVLLTGLIMLTEPNIVISTTVDKDISTKYIVDEKGRIRKIDNTDFPFTKDNTVLGEWVSIDFIEKPNDFIPNKKSFRDDLYINNIHFFQNGQTNKVFYKWSKNFIICPYDKTVSRYYIKIINNTKYMFLQWKSGDYAFRNSLPRYYVLKKVK